MIISDLQFIETADNSEVQGAGGKYKDYSYYYKKYSKKFAKASADADAKAFGDKTDAYTNTFAIADADAGVSLSGSKSYAAAYSYH